MGGKGSGRRPKYTAALHAEIVKALEGGMYRAHAAQLVGIGKRTLEMWLEKGHAGHEKYAQLAIDCDAAAARDIQRNQLVISRAATGLVAGDWKAAAWSLERKYPREYGLAAQSAASVTVQHGAADGDSSSGGNQQTRVEFYLPSNQRRPEEQE